MTYNKFKSNSCNRVINYHKTQWIHAEKMPLMLQYCTVISCKCIKKPHVQISTQLHSHTEHITCAIIQYNSIEQ